MSLRVKQTEPTGDSPGSRRMASNWKTGAIAQRRVGLKNIADVLSSVAARVAW